MPVTVYPQNLCFFPIGVSDNKIRLPKSSVDIILLELMSELLGDLDYFVSVALMVNALT